MGLMKKFTDKLAAMAPDYEGEVRKLMQPGEELLGVGLAITAAPEYDTSVGMGGRKIISAAINAASEARKKSKYLSGDDDSCALAIPRIGNYLMVAISDQRASFWDFGMMMRDVPLAETLAFPRTSVTSILATGETDKYGIFNRFSFVDGSYADMKIQDQPISATFRAAADGIGA
jgi:hypothetical protein